MNLTIDGLKTGFIKFVKVIGWVAASALISAAIQYVSSWHPTGDIQVALVGLINAVLAGLGKLVAAEK
jgi:hypothetical protein